MFKLALASALTLALSTHAFALQQWTLWTVTPSGQMQRVLESPIFSSKSECESVAAIARLSPRPDGIWADVVCRPVNYEG
jgi:hypothetical protein